MRSSVSIGSFYLKKTFSTFFRGQAYLYYFIQTGAKTACHVSPPHITSPVEVWRFHKIGSLLYKFLMAFSSQTNSLKAEDSDLVSSLTCTSSLEPWSTLMFASRVCPNAPIPSCVCNAGKCSQGILKGMNTSLKFENMNKKLSKRSEMNYCKGKRSMEILS